MQTTGGATPLMYACQQGRENEVLDLIIKQPYSVKDRDRTLKTPLHYCAENSNTSCAEAILRIAPELVNAQDENGYCTLHLAVIAGNKLLIKLLIIKGADINIQDNEGHSAVHWAIVSSEKEALEMIIRTGANASTPDIHGGYPLHYAVQMCGSHYDYCRYSADTIKVVETLLFFGVDVNVKDKDGRQPILWAASAGSVDAVIHLINGGASVEAADKDGLTALHCAASRGHTGTVEALVTLCSAHVDLIDGNGCSALFYAVTLGHADSTEVLLRLGAEPNRQDRKGRTPAHCGAAKGQMETLRILQKHGGNLWMRNVKGDLPVHEAVASGRKDLVLWLLSQNSDAVNTTNNDGRSLLHIASMYNNTDMIKTLIEAKSLVNPVMRTSKGVLMTPFDVALCKGHRSCGKYLQLHGGVPFSKVSKTATNFLTVRISPSDEMMSKSGDASASSVTPTYSKISKNSHQDGQVTRTESGDKKRVYRRRKKRKSHSNENKMIDNSDSNDDFHDVKIRTQETRRSGKSRGNDNEVDVGYKHDPDKMEGKKDEVASENVKSAITAKDNTHTQKNTVGVAEDIVIKKVSESKSLQRNKSFNEHKNVSNLSPEDFPPFMESISQLDKEMMKSEIDINKPPVENENVESDLGSRLQSSEVMNTTNGTQSTEIQIENEGVKKGSARDSKTRSSNELGDTKTSDESGAKSSNDEGQAQKDKSKKDAGKKRVGVVPPKEEKLVAGTKVAGVSSKKNEKSTNGGTKSSDSGKEILVKKDEETNKSSKEGIPVQKDEKSSEVTESKSLDASNGVPIQKHEKSIKDEAKNSSDGISAQKDDSSANVEAKRSGDEISFQKNDGIPSEKNYQSTEGSAKKSSDSNENFSMPTDENFAKQLEDKNLEGEHSIEKDKTISHFLETKPDLNSDTVFSVQKEKTENVGNVLETRHVDSDTVRSIQKEESADVAATKSSSREIAVQESENCTKVLPATSSVDGISVQKHETSLNIIKTESLEPENAVSIQKDGDMIKLPQTESVPAQKGRKPTEVVETKNYIPENGIAVVKNESPPVSRGKGSDESVVFESEEKPKNGLPVRGSGRGDARENETPSSGDRKKRERVVGTPPELPSLGYNPVPQKNAHGKDSMNEAESHSKGSSPTVKTIEENIGGGVKEIVESVSNAKSNPTDNENSKTSHSPGRTNENRNGRNDQEVETTDTKVPIKKEAPIEGADSSAEPHHCRKEGNGWISCDGERERHYTTPRVARLCRRNRDFRDENQISVTQLVQNTIRKYHMERGIFYQLLELKRMQIRSGKANEQVLVKRLADEYERTRVFLGMKHFSGLYRFRDFEKFLYDQLKTLNSRSHLIIPEMKSYDDIDALSGVLKKSRFRILNDTPQEDAVCTCITQRCHHTAHAYTSVPCSAYVANVGRHRIHKPRRECFLPRIDHLPNYKSERQNVDVHPATLELVQGSEKQVISLPGNYPDKGKRYYVTFTIKGAPSFKEHFIKHRHAKSV